MSLIQQLRLRSRSPPPRHNAWGKVSGRRLQRAWLWHTKAAYKGSPARSYWLETLHRFPFQTLHTPRLPEPGCPCPVLFDHRRAQRRQKKEALFRTMLRSLFQIQSHIPCVQETNHLRIRCICHLPSLHWISDSITAGGSSELVVPAGSRPTHTAVCESEVALPTFHT